MPKTLHLLPGCQNLPLETSQYMFAVQRALQNLHALSGLISQSLLKTKELTLALSTTVSFQNRSRLPKLTRCAHSNPGPSSPVAHLLTTAVAEIKLLRAYAAIYLTFFCPF